MASYRRDKMASLIRSITGAMIANKLSDPRISPFASVTRVELSADLQVAKVYVSVMGNDADQTTTMRGLEHARGRIQREVAKNIRARHCPELRFISDASIKKAARIMQIIEDSVPPPPEEADRDDDLIEDMNEQTERIDEEGD